MFSGTLSCSGLRCKDGTWIDQRAVLQCEGGRGAGGRGFAQDVYRGVTAVLSRAI